MVYPLSKLVKTSEIGGKYAADQPNKKRKMSLPAHVVLARRLTEMGDVREPGERIEYMFIENEDKDADLCDRIQEPNHWRNNGCMPRIDFCMYVEKQFTEAISQIFNVYFNKEDTDHFGKFIRNINNHHRHYQQVRREIINLFRRKIHGATVAKCDGNVYEIVYKKWKNPITTTEKPNYLPDHCWNKNTCRRYTIKNGKPREQSIETFLNFFPGAARPKKV